MSNQIKVAYQSFEGINVEQVTSEAFKNGTTVQSQGYPDLASISGALQQGTVTHSILPYENSLSGTFLNSLDFLLRNSNFKVVGEVVLHEDIVLAGAGSSNVQDITKVVLDSRFIEQTRTSLNKLFNGKNIVYEIQSDIIPVVEILSKDSDKSTAFVGSSSISNKYNLKVLDNALVENSQHNFTRYFIISLNDVTPERHQSPKTTIAITLKNSPGTLMKVFSTFALRDINVYKVESRASARSIRSGSSWEYTMIVDVDGAPKVDEKLERAIESLNEFATNVHVLGSYPRYFPPPTFNLAPVGL